ncbi:hypothetical protein [Granulicella arctica]|uniref:hypothetical protein n=1 Tax=Granulicella arctica TaxID=940613 RepID=UPI0021E0F6F3|nr:hypothetical protein [Granulicella arctica]
MSTRASVDDMAMEPDGPVDDKDNAARALVTRILASPDFIRSPQLSKFLLYICKVSFEGRSRILSEQHVGVEVFGRAPDYDTAADTIVRSHALRLRRRLEQYFQRAGRHEPLHLIVPRGGYVPIFLAVPAGSPPEDHPVAFFVAALSETETEAPAEGPGSTYIEGLAEPGPSALTTALKTTPVTVWRHRFVIAVLALLLIILSIAFGFHLRSHFLVSRHHPLWGRLFTDDQPTRIVLGDSGMVLFHATTRRYVSLHDYLSHDLSKQLPFVEQVEPHFAEFLAGRRYTSMVDAMTLAHLLRLPEALPERTLVHYARDMRLEDFKSSNLIIIGAQEAVPWVELFEPSMDFVFSIDNPERHSTFVNKQPRPGESQEYNSYSPATRTKAYAVLAFLPNLSGTGNVLILEGLSMPGTEAAADLAMDDDRLLPLLNKIRKPNGSLPHFEMLLESDTVGAISESAKPARLIALHVHE